MPADKKQNNQSPEILAALLDFARLAQQVNGADAQSTETTARLLLERVIALCHAQRGALMITQPETTMHISLFHWRLLATWEMHEQAVHMLVKRFTTQKQHLVWDDYRWSLYPCVLTNSSTEEESNRPVQALLILGWARTKYITQEVMMVDKERSVFLVEDAIKAVLTNIILAERVQELESRPYEATGTVEHMQTDLLGTVSHELRSPLASIKGYTAMLLHHDKRLHREERKEFLEAIDQAADDLSIIVDLLLEMAQLESNEIHIERAAVDMRRLVMEAIHHTHQTRRYLLATATQPDFFTFVLQTRDTRGQLTDDVPLAWADQRYMRQVLDNILENALKFSPHGGTITVTLQPVEQPSPEATDVIKEATEQEPGSSLLQIAIHDEGMGIPDEHLVRIFDRFQRVDTRLTREVNGLGLGLAICKRIIELHEGDLWAESQPEAGSTFFLQLPLADSIES